jgi:hypothetical protein
MKHKHAVQNKKHSGAVLAPAVQPMDPSPTAFVPSPDEVARRAYFTYVNQGSLQGHEVQHWLVAEAELTAERNRPQVHGFHS